MSALRHATISAWQRHEDGSYAAELNGWTLHVRWRPAQGGPHHERRGFYWAAEKLGSQLVGDDVFEEMEVAMAHAEEATDPGDPPVGEADTHDAGEHGAHH
jgi:hypothetical protein